MISTKTKEELWDQILERLKPELKGETFDLWLKPLRVVRFEDGRFVLRVPNRFFSDWIKAHFQPIIEQVLAESAGAAVALDFETQSEETLPLTFQRETPVVIERVPPSPVRPP